MYKSLLQTSGIMFSKTFCDRKKGSLNNPSFVCESADPTRICEIRTKQAHEESMAIHHTQIPAYSWLEWLGRELKG